MGYAGLIDPVHNARWRCAYQAYTAVGPASVRRRALVRLILKLPVVAANIQAVAGVVLKMGRQPIHQQG